MGHFGDQVVAILTAIIGVAIVAVIVSKRSDTTNVVSSAFSAFSGLVSTAVSPITGSVGAGGGFSTSLFQPPQQIGGLSF